MTVTAAPARVTVDRAKVVEWFRRFGVYVALGLLVLFNVIATPHFTSVATLKLELIQVTPVLILAMGLALVIGSEGIDISVGSVMALTAAVLPLYLGYGTGIAIAIALITGVAAGVVNGLLIAVLGIQPIVATLGTLVAARGLALVIANGRLTEIFDPGVVSLGTAQIAGIPTQVLVALVIVVLTAIVVRRTVFGRQLVAIGGNRQASVLAGLPVRRVLVLVYVISALLAAIAGVIATARSGASDPSYVGLGLELSAIAAVVVGGTPLSGGRITVLGTVAGALLMQLLGSTLIKLDLRDSDSHMVTAAIIVVAVYVQSSRRKR